MMRLNVYIKQLKNAIQCLKPNCLLMKKYIFQTESIENSEDPDQSVLREAVLSGSALFARLVFSATNKTYTESLSMWYAREYFMVHDGQLFSFNHHLPGPGLVSPLLHPFCKQKHRYCIHTIRKPDTGHRLF